MQPLFKKGDVVYTTSEFPSRPINQEKIVEDYTLSSHSNNRQNDDIVFIQGHKYGFTAKCFSKEAVEF